MQSFLPRTPRITRDRERERLAPGDLDERRDPHASDAVADEDDARAGSLHHRAPCDWLLVAVVVRGGEIVAQRLAPAEQLRSGMPAVGGRQRRERGVVGIEHRRHHEHAEENARRDADGDHRHAVPVEHGRESDRALDHLEAQRREGSRDRRRDGEQRERGDVAAVGQDDDHGPVPQVDAVGDTPEVCHRRRRQHLLRTAARIVFERDDQDEGNRGNEYPANDRTHRQRGCREHEERGERGRAR